MQTENSIFKEIKFKNMKCQSFLDVASIDQIKGKMDCLKFLSTPYAFDAMVLKEQDFYKNKKEETYEKIINLTQMNKFLCKKSSNKLDRLNLNSRKVSKHSMKNKNMDSSNIVKLLDEKTLRKYFEKKKLKKNSHHPRILRIPIKHLMIF
jgi:hypothetical protein